MKNASNKKFLIKRITISIAFLICSILVINNRIINSFDDPNATMIILSCIPALVLLLLHSIIYTILFCLRIFKYEDTFEKYSEATKYVTGKSLKWLSIIYILAIIYAVSIPASSLYIKANNSGAEISLFNNSVTVESLSNFMPTENVTPFEFNKEFYMLNSYYVDGVKRYSLDNSLKSKENNAYGKGTIVIRYQHLKGLPKWYINIFVNDYIDKLSFENSYNNFIYYNYNPGVKTIEKENYVIYYTTSDYSNYIDIIIKYKNECYMMSLKGYDDNGVFIVYNEEAISAIENFIQSNSR